MFVEPDADDVVPTGCIVALETLVHARVLLVSELLGNHREVLHEVTWGRQMTLHTLFGFGGRVLVAAHDPRLEGVALCTVASEPFEVWILAIMAGGAIERFTRCPFVELIGTLDLKPSL